MLNFIACNFFVPVVSRNHQPFLSIFYLTLFQVKNRDLIS